MNDTVPFISVVIPAFNEEKYLSLCLKALQTQSYPKNKFEVIVVDNNSTDQTAEIARKYGAKVIFEKKQGHIFALNRGMQEAEGEIIASTDADTVVSKDWLVTLDMLFHKDIEVVGVTGPTQYLLNSKIKTYLSKIFNYLYLKVHLLLGRLPLCGNNLAVRRAAFYQVNGLDMRYRIFGDAELGLRIKKLGKVVFCKELAVTTSSRRWDKGTWEDYYKYFNSYLQTIWFLQPPKGDLTPRR